MLMKIALVLITIMIVAAAFLTLLNDGGDAINEGNKDTNDKLDCVMENKADALDECKEEGSLESDMEGGDIEA